MDSLISFFCICLFICYSKCKGDSIVSPEITFVFSIMVHKWGKTGQPNFDYLVLNKDWVLLFWGDSVVDQKCGVIPPFFVEVVFDFEWVFC